MNYNNNAPAPAPLLVNSRHIPPPPLSVPVAHNFCTPRLLLERMFVTADPTLTLNLDKDLVSPEERHRDFVSPGLFSFAYAVEQALVSPIERPVLWL